MTVGGVVLVCDDCAGHYQLRITSQIQSSHTKRAVGDCNWIVNTFKFSDLC